MRAIAKLSGLFITGIGALVMQNSPEGVISSICSWDLLNRCPGFLNSENINHIILLLLFLTSGIFLLSLITPYLEKNYEQTVTGIAWADPKISAEQTERAANRVFRDWDPVDPLTIMQAACLWAGYQPFDYFHVSDVPPVYAKYLVLQQAVRKQEMKLEAENLRVTMRARADRYETVWHFHVSRNELRRFINAKKLRPVPFAFPEDR